MTTGVEAASLFVRIGDIGASETLQRILAVGALVDRINGDRADIRASADTRQALLDLGRTRDAAELLDKLDPRVVASAEDLATKSLDSARRSADLLDAKHPIVTASADTGQADRGLQNTLATARRLDATNPIVDIRVEADRPKALLEQVQSRAEIVGRMKPTVVANVNARAAIDAVDALRAKLQALDEMEPVVVPQVTMPGMGMGMTGGGQVGTVRMLASQMSMLMQPGFAGPMMIQQWASGMGAAKVAAGGLAAGIALVGAKAIQAQGEFERFETQFKVLLGTAEKAKQRISELTTFAAKTPFELPEVVAASKTLEMFTKGALATGDGLRLVGDVAAGTGTNLGETAMWFGRLYDAMKSGRPFGEATMRLQEMGAISGEGRRKLEELGEAVQSGAQDFETAWTSALPVFERFSGMMEAQSKTTEGKLSNLADAAGQMFMKIGDRMEPIIHGTIDALIGAVGFATDVVLDFIDKIAYGIGLLEQAGRVATDVFADLARGAADLMGQGDMIRRMEAEKAEAIADSAREGARASSMLAGHLKRENAEIILSEAEVARQTESMKAEVAGDMFDLRNMVKQTNLFRTMQESLVVPVNESGRQASRSLEQTIDDMAYTLRGARSRLSSAASSLADSTYDPLILAAERAAVAAELKSKELQQALASKDPEIKRDAEQRVLELRKRLMEITADQLKYGNDASRAARSMGLLQSKEYLEGLHSTDKQRQLDAKAMAHELVNEIIKSTPLAKLWGLKTGEAYSQGLLDSAKEIKRSAYAAVAAAKGIMMATSPPGPESPLHDIDKWGYRTGHAWVEGLAKAIIEGKGPLRRKLEEVARVAVDFIKGIDGYIGAATPEGQRATLERQIGDLVRRIARTADPNERFRLIEDLVEKQRRLESLNGATATPEDVLIDRLRGYIAELDEAFANEKDPKKREDIAARIAEYLGRIRMLEDREAKRLSGEQAAADEAASKREEARSSLDALKDAILTSGIGSESFERAIYELEARIGRELPDALGEDFKRALSLGGFGGAAMQQLFDMLVEALLSADPNAADTFQANRVAAEQGLNEAVAEGTEEGIRNADIQYVPGSGGPTTIGAATINVNVQVTGGIVTPGVADQISNELGPALNRWVNQQRSDLVAATPTHTHD